MNKKGIIFALSTPVGKSAIAVFRISGEHSHKKIKSISSNKKKLSNIALLNSLIDRNKKPIDETLTTFFKAPKSFTGEDMVEISCHGSTAIIKKITKELLFKGLRLAEPGEFTRRSLENNKMDLTNVEGLADLINSKTEKQREQALKNYTGELSNFLSNTSTSLKKMLSKIEAIIDFSDEDLPNNMVKDILEQKGNIINTIEEIIKLSRKNRSLMSGFKISVIGKPNTGKSSFVNYVSGRDVSIVTKIPGTTRDPIESQVDIGGYQFVFIDTAGIRKHKNKIEKIGIQKSFEKSKNSDLNLVFLDKNETKEYKNVDNKLFVKSKYDIKKQGKTSKVYRISSKTGYGIATLLRCIQKKFVLNNKNELPIISRERQLKKLEQCNIHLKRANPKKNIDMAADDVRSAIKELDEIYHKFDIEQILDIIFNDFCIGK